MYKQHLKNLQLMRDVKMLLTTRIKTVLIVLTSAAEVRKHVKCLADQVELTILNYF